MWIIESDTSYIISMLFQEYWKSDFPCMLFDTLGSGEFNARKPDIPGESVSRSSVLCCLCISFLFQDSWWHQPKQAQKKRGNPAQLPYNYRIVWFPRTGSQLETNPQLRSWDGPEKNWKKSTPRPRKKQTKQSKDGLKLYRNIPWMAIWG